MSSERVSIFFTGATGYVGGAVLSRLLNHPDAPKFDITALVRDAEKAKTLESKFRVKALVGSLKDTDKILEIVERSHVVFNTAASDDVPFIKTLLSGLKRRHEKTGDVPILIHTSGAGVLIDDAHGEYATDVVYSDIDVEKLKSIPETAVHRNVELLVVQADEQGYVRSYLVLPSIIYAIAKHPLVDAGVSNSHSVHIPYIIRGSLERKRAGIVGKGKSVQSNVHIDDTADQYIVLYDAIVSNPDKVGHGWEGYYFGENGEHSWYQVSKAIGEALVELGVSDDPEPTPFSPQELAKYWGEEKWGWYSGSNSRCRADRSRALGWKPKYTVEDLLKSIRPEVEDFMRRNDFSALERQVQSLFHF